MQQPGSAPVVSPAQAALGVVATIPILIPYLAAGWALGFSGQLFAGFLFAIYWMVIKGAAPKEFWPTVVGFLGGLGTGWLLFALPPLIGAAGYYIAGTLIVIALFLFNLGAAQLFVNPPYLIMLTLGTSVVHGQADYAGCAMAIVLIAGYAGAMVALAGLIVKMRSGKPEVDIAIS